MNSRILECSASAELRVCPKADTPGRLQVRALDSLLDSGVFGFSRTAGLPKGRHSRSVAGPSVRFTP